MLIGDKSGQYKWGCRKVMNFVRWGENIRFWESNYKLTGDPTNPSVKKHETCSDPISADPFAPFRKCET